VDAITNSDLVSKQELRGAHCDYLETRCQQLIKTPDKMDAFRSKIKLPRVVDRRQNWVAVMDVTESRIKLQDLTTTSSG